ncbi:MAG TPA: condensation domain-containing protein, partial [Herpetosiphonaceae bacterium]
MTTLEFLARLRELDVRVWLDNDQLRVNAPEGVLTPELRADLVKHKGDILAFLRTTTAAQAADIPPILPAPTDQPVPVSFAQERLWFLDQLTPGSSVYVVPWLLRLSGPLDAQALHTALVAL